MLAMTVVMNAPVGPGEMNTLQQLVQWAGRCRRKGGLVDVDQINDEDQRFIGFDRWSLSSSAIPKRCGDHDDATSSNLHANEALLEAWNDAAEHELCRRRTRPRGIEDCTSRIICTRIVHGHGVAARDLLAGSNGLIGDFEFSWGRSGSAGDGRCRSKLRRAEEINDERQGLVWSDERLLAG